MKTSSCKQKGKRLCAAVREKLLAWAPDLKEGDIALPATSQPGEDLYLSPAAKEIYPLAFECKNQESLNIWAALKQSETHIKEGSGDIPLVAFTRNRVGKIYVALDLEHFLKLIR